MLWVWVPRIISLPETVDVHRENDYTFPVCSLDIPAHEAFLMLLLCKITFLLEDYLGLSLPSWLNLSVVGLSATWTPVAFMIGKNITVLLQLCLAPCGRPR